MVARWLVPVLALMVLACAPTAQAQSESQKKIAAYVKVAEKHKTTLSFFEARRWMLAPHYRRCWMAPGWHRRKVCRVARREVAETTARLANIRRVLTRLRTPPAPALPWAFWNCVASGWTGGAPNVGTRVSVGEGGATSYNSAGPYFGRYQADPTFIAAHGQPQIRKYGNSDPRTWSVLDQTIMAERGFQAQGKWAWPNTAPPCVHLR